RLRARHAELSGRCLSAPLRAMRNGSNCVIVSSSTVTLSLSPRVVNRNRSHESRPDWRSHHKTVAQSALTSGRGASQLIVLLTQEYQRDCHNRDNECSCGQPERDDYCNPPVRLYRYPCTDLIGCGTSAIGKQ